MTRTSKFTIAVAGGIVVVAAVVVTLLALRETPKPTQAGTPTAASAATPAASSPSPAAKDPYDVYLANNPRKDLVLSREDAQARAYLGCGQTWAPGTVDAVLADAYRPTGLCPK